MKKVMSLCVLAGILLSIFSGCGQKYVPDTSPEYNPETDHNVSMMTDFSTEMVETDTGFYYVDFFGEKLHYIEKSSRKDTILCGKPNCTHEDTDENCNAWVDMTTVDGIFLYDEKLYYVSRVQKINQPNPVLVLMQRSLDASSQKVVWELAWDTDAISSGTIQYYMMHRGKLYYIIQGDSSLRAVYEYDLHTKKHKEIFRTEDYVFELKGIGDYVFWMEHGYEEENTIPSIVQYHISTGNIVNKWNDTFFVTANEENLYFLQLNDTGDYKKIVQTDRNGENPVETGIEAWEISVDNTYIYADATKGRGWEGTLAIYRIGTWEKVGEIEMPDGKRRYMMPASNGMIFAFEKPSIVQYYINASAIGTPDFQWYEVEKVN